MPATLENLLGASTSDATPWRWLDEPAGGRSRDRGHAEDEGIRHAIGPLTGTNRIAAAFYEGSSWPRFKFWEQVFLWFQGPGVAAARRQVLRHLPGLPRARVLEVGIGEGDNLPLLPASWEVFGVDIARGRLRACRDRFPATTSRLAWAEGESLPFEDSRSTRSTRSAGSITSATPPPCSRRCDGSPNPARRSWRRTRSRTSTGSGSVICWDSTRSTCGGSG